MRRILFVLMLICVVGISQLSGMAKMQHGLGNLKENLVGLKVKLVDLNKKLTTLRDKLNTPLEGKKKLCPFCTEVKDLAEFPKLSCGHNQYCIGCYNAEGGVVFNAITQENLDLLQCLECQMKIKVSDWAKVVSDGWINGRYTLKADKIKMLEALTKPRKQCMGCSQKKPFPEFPVLACGHNSYCIGCYNLPNGSVWEAMTKECPDLLSCLECKEPIKESDWAKVVSDGWINGKHMTEADKIKMLRDLANAPKKECIVCLNKMPEGKFPLLKCGHNSICVYCYNDSGARVDQAITQASRDLLKCLSYGCNQLIEDDELQEVVIDGIVNEKQMSKEEKINRLILLSKKAAKDPNFRDCIGCDEYYILGYGGGFHVVNPDTYKYTCPKCNKEYCPKCQKAPHFGSACLVQVAEEQEISDADDRSTFFFTQKCPVCDKPGARDNHCLWMWSPCGHAFCFGCKMQDGVNHHVWVCRNGFIYFLKKGADAKKTTFVIRFGREVGFDFSSCVGGYGGYSVKYPKPGDKQGEYVFEYKKALGEECQKKDPDVEIESEIKKFELDVSKDPKVKDIIKLDVPELRVKTKIERGVLDNLLVDINLRFNRGIINVASRDRPEWHKKLYPNVR